LALFKTKEDGKARNDEKSHALFASEAKDYLTRPELDRLQRQRLSDLLHAMLPANRFYAEKIGQSGLDPDRLAELDAWQRLPFTTKAELIADQQAHPPYGSNLSYPLDSYTRMHQTSGTSGQPLRWLDTPQSWEWMLGCWRQVYRAAEIEPADRFFFPFSFGPFLGFWTAFEAATHCGCLALAGGGMTSLARLRFLLDNRVTVIVCTPTYALRLAEVAREHGIILRRETPGYAVRAVVVGGEPGGSIPATRRRIEDAWQARVFDQSGMTEIGPATCECTCGGVHLLEGDFIAEVLDPRSGQIVPPGVGGELVLTNLGRWGSPLLRYRTGDLVRVEPTGCECGRTFLRLAGGILGRTDDMIHVRGNNLYPGSLEAVIRRFPEVAEYQVAVIHGGALAEVRVAVEPINEAAGADLAERVAQAIRQELLFRADVETVLPGSLPRFEMKANRVVHERLQTPRNQA
jgi:phenylacetate-CoA ligase